MEILYGNPCIMGVEKTEGGYNFSVFSEADEVVLLLYKKGSREVEISIELDSGYKTGSIFSVLIKGIDLREYQYNYMEEGRLVPDPYAKTLSDCSCFGETAENPLYISCVELEDFDWQKDRPLMRPYRDTVIYKLHVRGYTKSRTSGVKNKGTFAGIIEKIPYLKSLGITAIELMPAYEYKEIQRFGEDKKPDIYTPLEIKRLNYWGYTGGMHFAPKAAFCANRDKKEDYTSEFKEMVRELHKNGIEVIMEMFFEKENAIMINDCIRFWVREYHIDGVHLYCPEEMLIFQAQDPLLSGTKIFVEHHGKDRFGNTAIYNDSFSKTARRILKGDEDVLRAFTEEMREKSVAGGRINYITTHNGFTMMDLVSYDRKHNEDNGENNRDGEDFNISWNCGVEGRTKKIKILELRQRQIKNAFVMLMTAQGVPLFMAGDEFENSQGGNNNPYCLDNETSWVNWNDGAYAIEILEFVKKLIHFRKLNSILHTDGRLMMADMLGCGYPDISYHSENAWFSGFEIYNRHIGIMYCSIYSAEDSCDELIYLAFNMHWEEHELALPKVADGSSWEIVIDTSKENEKPEICENRILHAGPRTVTVLKAKTGKQKGIRY